VKYHELKTDPAVFAAVAAGDKTHEIRFNDRDFQIGDVLHLRETVATGAAMRTGAPLEYTGRQAMREVSHIQTGYGLVDGWVILSFKQGEARQGRRKEDAHPDKPLEWGASDAQDPGQNAAGQHVHTDGCFTEGTQVCGIQAAPLTSSIENAMMTLDADRARRLRERGPDRRVENLAVPVERRSGTDRRADQKGGAV
jgi:hypothetical protein